MPRLTVSGQMPIPFSGKTSRARHASHAGAVTAAETRVWKTDAYLTWLLRVGGATDHEGAAHFDWPLATINSIRNALFDRGDVEAIDVVVGINNRRRTIWGPSAKARQQAAAARQVSA